MKFQDLLPAIGGFAAGAISPQTGKAGVATLDMMTNMKDRRRQREMADERMDMSRRSEGRSEQSFEWAKANNLYTAKQREDDEHERAMARNAAAKAMESFKGSAYPEYFNDELMGAETRAQVGQISTKIHNFVSNTPMSQKAADEYAAQLGPGEIAYVTVRAENGQLVRQGLRNPKYPYNQRSTEPGQLGSLEAITDVSDAMTGYENAQITFAGQQKEALDKAHEDIPDATMWGSPEYEGQIAKAGGGPIKVPRSSTATQRGKVRDAEADVQSAIADVHKYFAAYPELRQQIMAALAQTLGDQAAAAPAAAPAAGSGQPGGVVQSLVERYNNQP
ncbi:MAG TPA: hypothetical protein VMW79_07925 [Anaerolineae bacterium]|nr:hypothetical protein [Anaerolineae bacterium]